MSERDSMRERKRIKYLPCKVLIKVSASLNRSISTCTCMSNFKTWGLWVCMREFVLFSISFWTNVLYMFISVHLSVFVVAFDLRTLRNSRVQLVNIWYSSSPEASKLSQKQANHLNTPSSKTGFMLLMWRCRLYMQGLNMYLKNVNTTKHYEDIAWSSWELWLVSLQLLVFFSYMLLMLAENIDSEENTEKVE